MVSEIFVDTAAWAALADPQDSFHTNAGVIYKDFVRQRQRLITTNLIISETYTFIHRRMNHRAAVKFLTDIKGMSRLTKLYSTERLETQAEEILRLYSDQDFSFADAVSFAVMREQGITTVFSSDHHFLIAGFTLAQASGRS